MQGKVKGGLFEIDVLFVFVLPDTLVRIVIWLAPSRKLAHDDDAGRLVAVDAGRQVSIVDAVETKRREKAGGFQADREPNKKELRVKPKWERKNERMKAKFGDVWYVDRLLSWLL